MSDIKKLDFFLPNVLDPSAGAASTSTSQPTEGASFSDILKNALNSVDDMQHDAKTAVEEAASGANTDLHDTMIALQKADTSLKMMLEVRNKLLEAYQEVIKTQL